MLQAQRGRAGLVRGFAVKADDAVAAADADMDWSKLENLATSDEAKRMVANLRGTFRDEMQKLEAIAPEASWCCCSPSLSAAVCRVWQHCSLLRH